MYKKKKDTDAEESVSVSRVMSREKREIYITKKGLLLLRACELMKGHGHAEGPTVASKMIKNSYQLGSPTIFIALTNAESKASQL